jgi:RNA polymerase sigma-70 factor (ECF subfamily)
MGSSESIEELYEQLRPRAFAIAYRMLSSVGEAEDVVQEALLRLHRALEAGERIESPAAYVSTIVTRLAIDELRSARARREVYVGEWLPEPLLTEQDTETDPAAHAETADTLSFAFLAVLERLTPEQRAVFLLREVFDYPYAEIAEVLGRSQAAARQLAVRARAGIGEARPRFEASPEQSEQLLARFLAATEAGDVESLEELLAADVELHGDGGGKVPALAGAIGGRARVARTLSAWVQAGARFAFQVQAAEVNGGPGAVIRDGEGRVISVMSIELGDGEIRAIRSVVNPEKLTHIGPPADLAGLMVKP